MNQIEQEHMNVPHVRKRFVLCVNDYPHPLLPADWTEDQADAFCQKLRDRENEQDEKHQRDNPWDYRAWVFYHIKEVPETGEFRPYR